MATLYTPKILHFCFNPDSGISKRAWPNVSLNAHYHAINFADFLWAGVLEGEGFGKQSGKIL